MLTIILIVLILVIFFIGIGIYNSLVVKKNHIDRSFSTVDVLLKKKCDLIPNLVAFVKRHMQFEQKTLAEITRLRSQVMTGNILQNKRLILENQSESTRNPRIIYQK